MGGDHEGLVMEVLLSEVISTKTNLRTMWKRCGGVESRSDTKRGDKDFGDQIGNACDLYIL